jgi:hypothetical protein
VKKILLTTMRIKPKEIKTKATLKNTNTSKATSTNTNTSKRGRPRNTPLTNKPRKRGRPRKYEEEEDEVTSEVDDEEEEGEEEEEEEEDEDEDEEGEDEDDPENMESINEEIIPKGTIIEVWFEGDKYNRYIKGKVGDLINRTKHIYQMEWFNHQKEEVRLSPNDQTLDITNKDRWHYYSG